MVSPGLRASETRRPRFQFHLSTMVAVVFCAGVLLWLNMRDYGKVYFVTDAESSVIFGWPIPGAVGSRCSYVFWPGSEKYPLLGWETFVYWWLPDLIANLTILAGVLCLSEYWVRARSGPSKGTRAGPQGAPSERSPGGSEQREDKKP